MSWTPSSLSSLGLFWQPLFPVETKSVSICIKCGITFPLWVGWESPGASKRGWIWDDFVGRKPVKPLVCPRPIRNRGLIPFQSLPQRYFLRRSWVEQKSCPERISWNGRKQQIIQCITHVSLWQELNSKETLVENASKHECIFLCRNGNVSDFVSATPPIWSENRKLVFDRLFEPRRILLSEVGSPCVSGLFAFNLSVVPFC